jgi:hypothetical protein
MPKPALAEIQRPNDTRAARILARSLFRDMRANGYGNQQILALATELIDLVTRDMRGEGEEALDAAAGHSSSSDVELKIVGHSA